MIAVGMDCRAPSIVLSLLLAILLSQHVASAMANDAPPLIDPQVRSALNRGKVRVLVEVRIARGAPEGEVAPREAIASAQSKILSRLAGTRFSLVRQYKTVPFLALEINKDALPILESMGDLVTRVLVDPLITRNGDIGSGPERKGERQ